MDDDYVVREGENKLTMLADRQKVERNIAEFVGVYLSTAQLMTDRFSDRDDVFPEQLLTSYASSISVDAYLCKDGVVLNVVENSTGVASIQYLDHANLEIGQLLGPLTGGVFSGAGRPQSPFGIGVPIWRFKDLSFSSEFLGTTRPVLDLQFWDVSDVKKWSTNQSQQMAIEDVQDYLLRHALGRSVGVTEKRQKARDSGLPNLKQLLSEFESLIAKRETPEGVLQKFLTEHPIFLSPGYEEVFPEQGLGVGKQMAADFIIRVAPEEYMVVEIEKPSTRLTTKGARVKGGRVRGVEIHSDLTHAEGQIIDYLDWLNENILTARSILPGIHTNPRGMLVAGRRRDLDAHQLERFRRKQAAVRHQYELLTFDDLLERARLLLKVLPPSIG